MDKIRFSVIFTKIMIWIVKSSPGVTFSALKGSSRWILTKLPNFQKFHEILHFLLLYWNSQNIWFPHPKGCENRYPWSHPRAGARNTEISIKSRFFIKCQNFGGNREITEKFIAKVVILGVRMLCTLLKRGRGLLRSATWDRAGDGFSLKF